MPGLGALILVVGPSGVGKDTLLDGAAAELAATGRFHFVRRAVTRPKEAGGEDHIEMSETAFREAEAEGAFLLSWRAHGLCYGVPRAPAAELREAGITVVANVSRGAIDEARNRLQPVSVVAIDASGDKLAARLAARGREPAAAIEARLARAAMIEVVGRDVVTVRNDSDVKNGVAAMVRALEAASSAEWQPAD